MSRIAVVGGGLAGCEAAWQAAERGAEVTLFEMRPVLSTGAHHSDRLAELVCSNSLRADSVENAAGLLKEEMRRLNSLIISAADSTRIPAGGALAVDREAFAETVTHNIANHPRITLVREEVTDLPAGVTVFASGPLTSDRLAVRLRQLLGHEYLSFFDAAAPIVTADSVDMEKAFFASRYGKGDADYLNCPLTAEEYGQFFEQLVRADVQEFKGVDSINVFEGCMPIEEMANRGLDTMRFGPLKPVGLSDPRTGSRPYAVVQLRRDNREGTLYNMVGFQTRLRFGEQKRVFSLIPALHSAEFVRFGVMHRNTYINSRRLLYPSLALRQNQEIFFAGQMTGVEGYVESAASGLVAGINAARTSSGQAPLILPDTTAHGALLRYITDDIPGSFQPMNITFGLLPPLPQRIREKRARNRALAERALLELTDFFNKGE